MMTTSFTDPPVTAITTGTYLASLLGTIRSHLEGLQGYGVMALELIQNADDAGSDQNGKRATEIVFNVTDVGLSVWNDGEFTYCGQLESKPCPHKDHSGYSCDYHRIIEVASGGKLANANNIGRFGIGFVSTYQITDHPEIYSAGIKLTLLPESQQWQYEPLPETLPGTLFFLPWARNPHTDARLGLGASAITDANIQQLLNDFQTVLRQSLLFLRHLKRAVLKHNGQLVLACTLERPTNNTLLISFLPSDQQEEWMILRKDAGTISGVERIYEHYAILKTLKRHTQVSVAIRITPQPLRDDHGLLYAYLPTEQSTGLPLHINADFFPEADRKALIFSGNQHQQIWNELLIKTAALAIASHLEQLRDRLGVQQLWKLIARAGVIKLQHAERFPKIFHQFWDIIKGVIDRGARIALTTANELVPIANTLYPQQPLTTHQVFVLEQLGGKILHKYLQTHVQALTELKVTELNFERLVVLLAQFFNQSQPRPTQQNDVQQFYFPLWDLVNQWLPAGNVTSQPGDALHTLKTVRFLLSSQNELVSVNECYRALTGFKALEMQRTFHFNFVDDVIKLYPKLNNLIDKFDFQTAVATLNNQFRENKTPAEIVGNDNAAVQHFYSVLALLDTKTEVRPSFYTILKRLPIWLTGEGFVTANAAVLAGDFIDPTGKAVSVIDDALLDETARAFAALKLKIEPLTLDIYVDKIIPTLFDAHGLVCEEANFKRVITTLAKYQGQLLNSASLLETLQQLPLVPTQDGGWAKPEHTYERTDELALLLGDNLQLWVDDWRLPKKKAIKELLKHLGIRTTPIPQHLVTRLCDLAATHTTLPLADDIKNTAASIFYYLCALYDQHQQDAAMAAALETLATARCLLASNHPGWFYAHELYAPHYASAFASQSAILAFDDLPRLNDALLNHIGVIMEPATALVVAHLLQCIQTEQAPHLSIYQVLNTRVQHGDTVAIESLRGQPCIYDVATGKYAFPEQVFLFDAQLGEYACVVSPQLGPIEALLHCLGVKSQPDASDYVRVIITIAQKYDTARLSASDYAIYRHCIAQLTAAQTHEQLAAAQFTILRQHRTVLNRQRQLCAYDRVYLRDSEWHYQFFAHDATLDQIICEQPPEYWALFETVGVRRFSHIVQIELEFCDGLQREETYVVTQLRHKAPLLQRLLHDQPLAIRQQLATLFNTLQAVSYEQLGVKATATPAIGNVFTAPTSIDAFYHPAQHCLIFRRPQTDWLAMFNALLRPLVSADITRIVMNCDAMMQQSYAQAAAYLTRAGLSAIVADDGMHLPSIDAPAAPNETVSDDVNDQLRDVTRAPSDEQIASEQRLLVRMINRQPAAMEQAAAIAAQRELNVLARRYVRDYEQAQGRMISAPSPQYPHCTFVSTPPQDAADARHIVVIGRAHTAAAVTMQLSFGQFNDARALGAQCWLYVVALDDNHQVTHIATIHHPVNEQHIHAVVLDAHWQELARNETPAASPLPAMGTRVHHAIYGDGVIVQSRQKQHDVYLKIQFNNGDKQWLPLALTETATLQFCTEE